MADAECALKKFLVMPVPCLLAALAFWPVTHCGFVSYDDPVYLTENPNVQGGLSLENILWAFTSGRASNWHPLTWLSHLLDVQLYGLHPLGHHLTSLLFHLANAALVFVVFKGLTRA